MRGFFEFRGLPLADLETPRPRRARGACAFTFIIFLVRRVANSLPAGRVEKNEPNVSATNSVKKAKPNSRPFNLNRNVFAMCRQNRPRENLVSGGVYSLMTCNTS